MVLTPQTRHRPGLVRVTVMLIERYDPCSRSAAARSPDTDVGNSSPVGSQDAHEGVAGDRLWGIRPSWRAREMAAVRLAAPSLPRTWLTCCLAVSRLTTSSPAMAWLVRPAASSCSTSAHGRSAGWSTAASWRSLHLPAAHRADGQDQTAAAAAGSYRKDAGGALQPAGGHMMSHDVAGRK
jgi:hypothetical protein